MFSTGIRWLARGLKGRQRAGKRPAVSVEALDGRILLSYFVVQRGPRAIPVHSSDARSNEPLFSNGLAVKKSPHFYQQYTGPRRPELNGVRAAAYVSGTNLVLSGTVAAAIVAHPTSADQSAIYSFAIDRGGSPEHGPYPGRSRIHLDSEVVVSLQPKGTSAFVSVNDPVSNLATKPPKSLASSQVSIQGDTITVTVPLSMLPSTGKAVNQWNVNFFVRNPNQKGNFHSIASFTPEFTEFQVADKQRPGI